MGLFRKKGKGEEGEQTEPPVERKKSERTEKTEPKAESVQKPKEDESKPANKKAAYVVCTHQDGGWQVKKAGSSKAIKRFDTKVEADAYAKKLASNNGATVIRKKKDGKIQKKL